MAIFVGPTVLFGMGFPTAYGWIAETLFGHSLPVLVISVVVQCMLISVVCWLLLLPLGEWLAGIQVVVNAE